MVRRVFNTLLCVLLIAGPAWAQQPPNAGQSGFVPLDSMPPREQIPAAPLLLSSYGFFLVLMVFYLWTIWRRLSKVEQDMHELERRQGTAKR